MLALSSALTLALVVLVSIAHARRPRRSCNRDDLAVYKVTFVAEWSKARFPRMYPLYRPRPQWSKLIGRSHDASYQLWSPSSRASRAFGLFATDADSRLLEADTQGVGGVYDTFTAPRIATGVGKTSAVVVLDGAHAQVSVAVKLIPSPDWFVGVSNLKLCRWGRWKRLGRIRLEPYDAGTDNGLTFTSPDWKTNPSGNVTLITSRITYGPASSFYYSNLKRLRRLGLLSFERMRVYKAKSRGRKKGGKSHTKGRNVKDKRKHVKIDKKRMHKSCYTKTNAHRNKQINRAPKRKKFDSDIHTNIDSIRSRNESGDGVGGNLSIIDYVTELKLMHVNGRKNQPDAVSRDLKNHRIIINRVYSKPHKCNRSSLNTRTHEKINLYTLYRSKKKTSKNKTQNRSALHDPVGDVTELHDWDVFCHVGDWSQWSACSRSCGFGEKTRTRKVMVKNKTFNKLICPSTRDTVFCGSARRCRVKAFHLIKWRSSTRTRKSANRKL